ncbi:MAG: Spi family protease inhibitor [Bacteroidales bacterium]
MGQEVDFKTVEKVSLNVHSLLIATEDKEVKISKIIPISKDESSLGYIINFDDNSFLIISGDYAIKPVLGYCKKNGFSYDNVPPGLLYLINRYEAEIKYARDNRLKPTNLTKSSWQALKNNPNEYKSLFSKSDVVSPYKHGMGSGL